MATWKLGNSKSNYNVWSKTGCLITSIYLFIYLFFHWEGGDYGNEPNGNLNQSKFKQQHRH